MLLGSAMNWPYKSVVSFVDARLPTTQSNSRKAKRLHPDEGVIMSNCLHCQNNDLVEQHARSASAHRQDRGKSRGRLAPSRRKNAPHKNYVLDVLGPLNLNGK